LVAISGQKFTMKERERGAKPRRTIPFCSTDTMRTLTTDWFRSFWYENLKWEGRGDRILMKQATFIQNGFGYQNIKFAAQFNRKQAEHILIILNPRLWYLGLAESWEIPSVLLERGLSIKRENLQHIHCQFFQTSLIIRHLIHIESRKFGFSESFGLWTCEQSVEIFFCLCFTRDVRVELRYSSKPAMKTIRRILFSLKFPAL